MHVSAAGVRHNHEVDGKYQYTPARIHVPCNINKNVAHIIYYVSIMYFSPVHFSLVARELATENRMRVIIFVASPALNRYSMCNKTYDSKLIREA